MPTTDTGRLGMSPDEYDFDEAWDDVQGQERIAGAEDAFRAAYARALVRLPAKVRDFALERCLIFTIGRDGQQAAVCWPASIVDKRQRRWIIVMDEDMGVDVEATIAHEIAHAWLGHRESGSAAHPHSNDVAADDLAVEWGFARSYPDQQ